MNILKNGLGNLKLLRQHIHSCICLVIFTGTTCKGEALMCVYLNEIAMGIVRTPKRP